MVNKNETTMENQCSSQTTNNQSALKNIAQIINKSYYNKLIYVAGAYGGSETNKKYIEHCCRKLSENYTTYCFINGISEFAHWYEKSNNTMEDLKRCITLMKKCDEVWVMTQSDWEKSQGTMVEIFVAYENNIPVIFDKDKSIGIERT